MAYKSMSRYNGRERQKERAINYKENKAQNLPKRAVDSRGRAHYKRKVR